MEDEHIEKFLGLGKKKGQEDPQATGNTGVEAPESTSQTASGGKGLMEKVKNTFSGKKPAQTTPQPAPQTTGNPPESPKTSSEKNADGYKPKDSVPKQEDMGKETGVSATSESGGSLGSPEADVDDDDLDYEYPEENAENGPEEDSRDQSVAEQRAANKQQAAANQAGVSLTPGNVQPSLQDRAKAYAADLGIGGVNFGAGAVEAADKGLGVLQNIIGSIMSGNAFGIGETVGESIIGAAEALRPIKNSINTALGIDERTGKVDPERVGTMMGGLKLRQKERIEQFDGNLNKWLDQSLGPGANTQNLMEYMNGMSVDDLNTFADNFEALVNNEKSRLYQNAHGGNLDEVDQKMMDSYENIGKTLKQVAHQKAREHHLNAAMEGTMATQERNKIDAEKQRYSRVVDDLKKEFMNDPNYNGRDRALFGVMERTIRNAQNGNDFLIKDPTTGKWSIKEDAISGEDWGRVKRSLEDSKLNRPLDPEETALLDEAYQRASDRLYGRAKEMADIDRKRSKIDRMTSPIDRMMADNNYRHIFKPKGFNRFFIPLSGKGRDAMFDEAGIDIANAQNKIARNAQKKGKAIDITGSGWNEYLEGLATTKRTQADMSALRAQNVRHMISMYNKNESLIADSRGDNSENMTEARAGLEAAADRVAAGRTLKAGDKFKPYRTGVQPMPDGSASPEMEYVDAYNDMIAACRDSFVQNELRGMTPGTPEFAKASQRAWERALDKYRDMEIGDALCTEIFGPQPNYPVTVSPTTKHVRVDAEGLTYGELFPIVKSHLGLSDDDADRFIKNNMDNVGQIDNKEQLQDAMSSVTEDDLKMFDPPQKKEGGTGFTNNRRNSFIPTGRTHVNPGEHNSESPYFTGRDTSYKAPSKPPQTTPQKPVEAPTPRTTPMNYQDVTEAYLRSHIGDKYGTDKEARALRNAFWTLWQDRGVKNLNDLDEGTRRELDIFNNRYKTITAGDKHPEGQSLYDPNVLRGKKGQTVRTAYEEDTRNKDNTAAARFLANRYYPISDDKEVDYVTDIIKNLLNSGDISFDTNNIILSRKGQPYAKKDDVRQNYLNAYKTFKRLSDRYLDDPKAQEVLTHVWRNFVVDLIEDRNTTKLDNGDRVFMKELSDRYIDTMEHLGNNSITWDDDSKADARAMINRLLRKRLQQMRNGTYKFPKAFGHDNFLSSLDDDFSKYGNGQLNRLMYDRIRENEVEPAVSKFKSGGNTLSRLGVNPKTLMDEGANASSAVTEGRNAMYKFDTLNEGVQFLHDLEKEWAEVKHKVAYDPEMTDEDSVASQEYWKKYCDVMNGVIKGMNDVFKKFGENEEAFNTVKQKKAPSGGKVSRKTFSQKMGTNWDVDAVEDSYRERMGFESNNPENSFVRNNVANLLDMYQDLLKRNTSKEDFQAYASNFAQGLQKTKDDDLDDLELWFRENLRRAQAVEKYKESSADYRKIWKDPLRLQKEKEDLGVIYDPRTVTQYFSQGANIPMLKFYHDLIMDEKKRRAGEA